MEEERAALTKEDSERRQALALRQKEQLEAFDVETTAMGLSASEVAAASVEPGGGGDRGGGGAAENRLSMLPPGDLDRMSTQGSTLSLSASSSTNSFSSQTPL